MHVGIIMAREMHYLCKVKITSWDLNDPHELTIYLFFLWRSIFCFI